MRVQGASMNPTLRDGDIAWLSILGEPGGGDVVAVLDAHIRWKRCPAPILSRGAGAR